MNLHFTIRPANPADHAALSVLYRDCLATADWFPKEALGEIDFEKDTADELVLVAEADEGELLGFIGVWQPDSFIHHLYIAAPFRGQGIGKAFLASLAGMIPYPWRLKCVVANRAAHAFYTSLGWRETDRSTGPRGEYWMMQYDGP